MKICMQCFLRSFRTFSVLHSQKLSQVAATNQRPSSFKRDLLFPNPYRLPKQAWVESLRQEQMEKLTLIDLHPDIFGAFPRVDILHQNVMWQKTYRKIDNTRERTRAEIAGGGRKPWQQKGLGKARHGSIRSNIWLKGGKAHAKRSPRSNFYMLPTLTRVFGLRCCFSVKYAQDDLRIVDSLKLPTSDPNFLETLVQSRAWGLSVLFVDSSDIFPENISIATGQIDHFNIMPVYGLNVYSMLRHECLVLTTRAVDEIESKLLHRMNHPIGETRFQPPFHTHPTFTHQKSDEGFRPDRIIDLVPTGDDDL